MSGIASTTRPLQRTPTELLVHYFEVNFDEVAEDLAHALEAEGPPRPGGPQLRQRAASNLRELIRSLIALRAHGVEGVEEPLRVADGLPGLEPSERELLRQRMLALAGRMDTPAAGAGVEGQGGVSGQAASVSPAQALALPTSAAPGGADAAAGGTAATLAPGSAAASAAAPMGPPPAPAGVTRDQRGRPAPMASVLQALAGKAVEVTGADLCQVFLVEDGVLTLRAEAPSHPSNGQPAGPAELATGAGFAGQVLRLGAASISIAAATLSGAEAAWPDRGMRAIAGVGLGGADARGGILVVGRVRQQPFDGDALATLQKLATETSLALASADLVSRAEELAVLGERLKLAREIHDGLASDLSAVVALFKYHDQRRKTDPEDAERLLQQMRGLVEESLRSARDILATLRPRQRVQGRLEDAVRRQVDDFARTYGTTALVSVMGGEGDLLGEERDTIFQVLREALTNIRKHAGASTVEVNLDMRDRPFTLSVDDDGVGIEVDAALAKSGSFGISGMRERAELVGGVVELTRSHLGGARLLLRGAGSGPRGGETAAAEVPDR